MKLIILGSKSDIAIELAKLFRADDWFVSGWSRGENLLLTPWNLIIIALGRVAPVGKWMDNDPDEWDKCMESNLLLPVRLLRRLWHKREPNASVCFFAGSNPQKPMAGYSAYNAGKMALLKVVEQLDFETPDTKFFALGPGYVPTKIHRATLDAGWKNERIERGGGTPIAKIYDCLKWCLTQPKEVIGGRNICVSDMRPHLAHELEVHPNMLKLRRVE